MQKSQFWEPHERGSPAANIYESWCYGPFLKKVETETRKLGDIQASFTQLVLYKFSLELALVIILLTYLVINSDNVAQQPA